MKNAIEIVKIGTSHEIEDINEGSITIDTLLPISILQNEKLFHHSIRKFLDAMVRICEIDTSIPLEVKVKVTLIDKEQGKLSHISFLYKLSYNKVCRDCMTSELIDISHLKSYFI